MAWSPKLLFKKLKDTNNPLYNKIDKIIFVAVPQVGTPDAFVALLHGTELGHGFIMNKDRSRQLSENMSTIYNLLPSAGYFTTVDPAFAVDKIASFENIPFLIHKHLNMASLFQTKQNLKIIF